MFLKTIGYFPERLKNLYFLFALVLKAVQKSEVQIKELDFKDDQGKYA